MEGRIRPSIRDLTRQDDYDQLAFPDLQDGKKGELATKVSRTAPPSVGAGIPTPEAKAKPKSRFALQREREQAQKFNIDLESPSPSTIPPSRGIIKDIIEHDSTTSLPLPPSFSQQPTGFPRPVKLTHLERAALPTAPPLVRPQSQLEVGEKGEEGDMMSEISRMNEGVIAGMSEDEIREEQRMIRESMGLGEGVIKMLMKRGKKKPTETRTRIVPKDPDPTPLPHPAPPPPLSEPELEEGTPEYIRQKYFPLEPASSSLSWISPSPTSSTTPTYLLSGLPSLPSTPSSESYSLVQVNELLHSQVVNQRIIGYQLAARIIGNNLETIRMEREWKEVLVRAATRGLGERNLGIVREATRTLVVVFSRLPEEEKEKEKVQVEGKEPVPSSLHIFEQGNPYDLLRKQLDAGVLSNGIKRDVLLLLTLLPSPTLPTDFLASFVRAFVKLPWPPISDDDAIPSPSALSFLITLIKRSKKVAKELLDIGLVETTLRFIAILPTELSSPLRSISQDLIDLSFSLWTTLALYGLSLDLRTSAKDLLASGPKLSRKWWGLVTVWCRIAMRPEEMGNHEIVWSMIEGEEWEKEAVEGFNASTGEGEELRFLRVWLEGSRVNRPFRGEKEREWVKEHLDWTKLRDHVKRGGRAWEFLVEVDEGMLDEFYPREERVAFVERLFEEGKRDALATMAAVLPHLDDGDRLRWTIRLIPRLGIGEEVLCRDLTNWVIKHVLQHPPNFLHPILERPSIEERKLVLLKPFVTNSIVVSTDGIVRLPTDPTAKDIKLSTCQILDERLEEKKLLGTHWPMGVLNELLRSGTSKVINDLENDWDGSELELVRTALVLLRVLVGVGGQGGQNELVYELIKVFMLEKDNVTMGNEGAESELFRDDAIAFSMNALLDPITLSHPPPSSPSPSSLSLESISSLISSAPFYSLYTDLLGLYASISLSDPLFARFLLPPLAMTYPSDFRKLFWVDYAYLLKNIETKPMDVFPNEGGLRAFLDPLEENELVLSAYADALGTLKREKNEFLYMVAVNHVTGAILEGKTKRIASIVRGLKEETKMDLCRYSGDGKWERNEDEMRERREKLKGALNIN